MLAGCAGDGGLSVSKPGYSKYSNKVEEAAFETAIAEKTLEALTAKMKTEGTGEKIAVVGAKTGATVHNKAQMHEKFSGTTVNGVKIENETIGIEEMKNSYGLTTTRAESLVSLAENLKASKMDNGEAEITKAKDVDGNDVPHLSFVSDPAAESNVLYKYSYKEGTLYEKTKRYDYDLTEGTYTQEEVQEPEWELGVALFESMSIASLVSVFEYVDVENFAFYVDGSVLTIAGEDKASKSYKYSDKYETFNEAVDCVFESTTTFIAQVDMANTKAVLIEESKATQTLGTSKQEYSRVRYQELTITFEEPKFESIDFAKLKELKEDK